MNERILMTNFMLQRQAAGLAETTLASYRFALKDYWQYLCRNGLSMATQETVRDYLIYLQSKRYSVATIRDKWRVLHAYYQYCETQGLRDNPLQGLQTPPRNKVHARTFSVAEVQSILSYYYGKDDFCSVRDHAIMCLLLGTGMRRSELLGITRIEGDFISVVGKGNKLRNIPVSASLRSSLKRYTEMRASVAHCPYYIVTKDGSRMTVGGLRSVFRRLSEGTGISGKRFSPHTFRHTYATESLKNGMDIASLQRVLGHSDIATTAIYLTWNDDAAKDANEKSNPLNSFFGKYVI